MIKSDVIEISPALAETWLSRNASNRPLSKGKIAQYARDMMAGRWALNGEPIILSDAGDLNDGQHRLMACLKANLGFASLVVQGVARETRLTVDQGRARGAADYLQMDGAACAKNKSAVARLVIAYEASGGRHLGGRTNVTNAEVMARVASDERLNECAVSSTGGHRAKRAAIKDAVGGFLLYITPTAHHAYFEQVAYGEHIGRGDPAFAVRQRILMASRTSLVEKTEAYLRGLNAFIEGRSLNHVRLTGELPPIAMV